MMVRAYSYQERLDISEGIMISCGYPIPEKAGVCGSSAQWLAIVDDIRN